MFYAEIISAPGLENRIPEYYLKVEIYIRDDGTNSPYKNIIRDMACVRNPNYDVAALTIATWNQRAASHACWKGWLSPNAFMASIERDHDRGALSTSDQGHELIQFYTGMITGALTSRLDALEIIRSTNNSDTYRKEVFKRLQGQFSTFSLEGQRQFLRHTYID